PSAYDIHFELESWYRLMYSENLNDIELTIKKAFQSADENIPSIKINLQIYSQEKFT
ncbi:1558_t:CDS:1, partial [Racocetra persica]